MLSTSTWLTIPMSCPALSTTGSRSTARSYMSKAACRTDSSGPTVIGGLVISSAAVTPAAFR